MRYFFIFLFSDTVELRSGKNFQNVRAKILKTSVEFDSEGSHQNFPKSSVKSIRLKPVVLKPPVTKEEVSEYEKEKVRVAESLQNADWSEGEEGKPRLAVLNFTPGAGVSQAEAETVTYLITTKLVQTKLFIIIDRLTMEKIIREETLKCRQGENCEKKVQNRLGANKILTGNVTKLGSRYFINGNIIDPKYSKIDFAEKAVAEKIDDLESSSEYFAKKTAGGILEFWDEPLVTKDGANSVPFLWRSAVFPGWGQFYYGNQTESAYPKWKAFFWGTATVGLAANTAGHYSEYNLRKNHYETAHRIFLFSASGSSLEILTYQNELKSFTKLEDGASGIKTSLGLLAGLYLLNIADVFFMTRTVKKEDSSNSAGLFFYPSFDKNFYQSGTGAKSWNLEYRVFF